MNRNVFHQHKKTNKIFVLIVLLLFISLVCFFIIGNTSIDENNRVLDTSLSTIITVSSKPIDDIEVEAEDVPPPVQEENIPIDEEPENPPNPPVVDHDRPDAGSLIVIDHVIVGDGSVNSDVDEKRRKIREGFVHCYSGYEKQCFGAGQLKPVSGKCKEEEFAKGLKLTTIDSLDTLLIMELNEYYIRARDDMVNLDFNIDSKASVFETNIRLVGGLLSAYAMTNDLLLLNKAEDLANKLLVAFDTPTGIPMSWVILNTGQTGQPSWSSKSAILSELGTLQLEFTYLSYLTGKPIFAEKVIHIFDQLLSIRPSNGLYPVYVKVESLRFHGNFVSAGALADSFYEYLLKLWLLTGKRDDKLKNWFFQEAEDIIDGLGVDIGDGMFYLKEKNGASSLAKMEHLTCFAGGMFALGSEYTDDVALKKKLLDAGKGIAKFCHEMYKMNPSGLPAEFVEIQGGKKLVLPKVGQWGREYLMRPEAVETWFVLHRVTKDPIYREWGWEFFESIEKHTRTAYGYSGIKDAGATDVVLDDNQQSFFLAETMKYLYLLFSPDNVIPLDQFVFNTEAHPIPIPPNQKIDFFLKP